MIALIGGRTTAAFAAVIVVATLVFSSFPTNAGDATVGVDVDVGVGVGVDVGTVNDCDNDGVGCGDLIMLEDFTSPRHEWNEMNDPVMGGKSTGTFSVDKDRGVGVFNGKVEIVSFLNAPGFIKAETETLYDDDEPWPDVSTCEGLQLIVKSSTSPSYKGFRVSFGNARPPDAMHYTYGYKTDLHLQEDDNNDNKFQQVKLPFEEFTDNWNAGTGDAVVTCAENKEFCPDIASKKDLYSIAVWGEGVEGNVDLQIQSISAYGCNSDSTSSSVSSSSIVEDEEDYESSGDDDAITIEDFSSSKSSPPINTWRTMNDPVMGGRSKSSVTIEDGFASFKGTCAIVPFLHAPGFITMTTGAHGIFHKAPAIFPDVSNCKALKLTVRTNDVDNGYDGYYVSFGTDRVPGGHHAQGYKTHLEKDKIQFQGEKFGDIVLPFSDFSSNWSDSTGKTKVSCKDDSTFCPSIATLKDMKTMSFWGEGVEGEVALDIQYIGAVGCVSNSNNSEEEIQIDAADVAAGMVVGGGGNNNNGGNLPLCVAGMVASCAAAAIIILGLFAAHARRRNGTSRLTKKSNYEEVKQVSFDVDFDVEDEVTV